MRAILSEIQSEKWAMKADALEAFALDAARLARDLRGLDIRSAKSPDLRSRLRVDNGTAVVPVTGVLLKTVPGWVRFFGIDATGYDEIEAMTEAAVADDSVDLIEYRISSPGGSVSGVQDAAASIRAAGARKLTRAVGADLVASAAYWLASQADSFEANETALVGSIGVYTVMVDSSEAAAMDGFRVHLVASGSLKGAGTPGVEITSEQLDAEQAVIDGLADIFVAAVASGRGMKKADVRALATGRVWLSAEARSLGLVDTITKPGRAATSAPAPAAADAANHEENAMHQDVEPAAATEVAATETETASDAVAVESVETPLDPEAPAAEEQGAGSATGVEAEEQGAGSATDDELVEDDDDDTYEAGWSAAVDHFAGMLAAFEGDVEFCAEQFAAGADLESAERAWGEKKSAEREARLAALEAENEELRRAAGRGVEPVAHGDSRGSGAPVKTRSEFKALVAEIQAERKCSRDEAVREARAQLAG